MQTRSREQTRTRPRKAHASTIERTDANTIGKTDTNRIERADAKEERKANTCIAFKEIPIKFEREDTTFPIKAVASTKVEPETLLLNINRYVNPNDICSVDYTRGGENMHDLEPINNLFSDNIVLGCYIPQGKIDTADKAIKDLLERARDSDDGEEEE
jgi:hypothetical protein